MVIAKNPDVVKWQCGRCSHWNDMEHGTCTRCKSPHQQFAVAYKLRNTLSSKEETFYDVVAPLLIREVQSLRDSVNEIVELLKDTLNGKTAKGK